MELSQSSLDDGEHQSMRCSCIETYYLYIR